MIRATDEEECYLNSPEFSLAGLCAFPCGVQIRPAWELNRALPGFSTLLHHLLGELDLLTLALGVDDGE